MHEPKNQIKTVLHTNIKQRHIWNAEKTPVMTRRKYDLYSECSVSAASVDASTQTLVKAGLIIAAYKNTSYENLNIFKSA